MSIYEPLMRSVIEPAVGAGVGFLNDWLSEKRASNAEDKAWNRTTEYNHPAQQKQRYIEAGLNPNLMYTSRGGGDAGNTNASIHNRNPSSVSDTMHKYLVLQGMHAQNKNLNAQTRLTNAEADYKLHEMKMLGPLGLRSDPTALRLIERIKPSYNAVKSSTWAPRVYNTTRDTIKKVFGKFGVKK